MLHIVAPHAPQFFCGLSGIAPDSAFSTWRITLNILRQVKQTYLSLTLRAVMPSLPGISCLTTVFIGPPRDLGFQLDISSGEAVQYSCATRDRVNYFEARRAP